MKIRKLLVGLCCVAAITLTASSASAITITLTDAEGPNAFLMGGSSTYSGTWDLTGDPDWPALGLGGWTIESVAVAITITDNAPQMGGAAAFSFESAPTAGTVGVTTSLLNWNQVWTSDLVQGSFSLFAAISLDGTLNYTVTRTGGNGFTLASAALTVTANDDELAAVPDGGTTLTMLGLGMVGLGALRRRLGV
jgi:hypothetical protein